MATHSAQCCNERTRNASSEDMPECMMSSASTCAEEFIVMRNFRYSNVTNLSMYNIIARQCCG